MTTAADRDKAIAALKAGLAAETDQRKAADAAIRNDFTAADGKLQAAIDSVGARVAILEAAQVPVPPVPVPPIPGPIPVGSTPPTSVDRTGKTDTTTALMSWLNSLAPGTLIDWDNGSYRIRQIMLEGKSLRFTGAGLITFTTMLTGNAAGLFHMRAQCHDMSFNHVGPGGTRLLRLVGPAPASDYGRAHASQEATENGHFFWMQGVQGIEIAGIEGYGSGGDGFYSGGYTDKANQWTHDAHIHDNTISAPGRMMGSLADGGTNILVEHNIFGQPIANSPITSLALAGPGWNGVIIEANDAPVGDGSAYGYANVVVQDNAFGRGYHPGGVSGGVTNGSANGGKHSSYAAPLVWQRNTSDSKYPWIFVNSYGNATSSGNS